jgi:lipopolysaccharide export system permease protein
MYVVMDMVFNFDEILVPRGQAASAGVNVLAVIKDVADYYFYQSFRIFVAMSGVIPVVAAAFTLLRFSRFSELTAFLAAGVSLQRIAVPIIVASVVLNALLVVDQEIVLPTMIPKLTRTRDEMHEVNKADSAYRISTMQVGRRALLMAARYHPPTRTGTASMEDIDLWDRDEDFKPVTHIFADQAIWDQRQQQWVLVNGRRVTGLLPDQIHSDEIPITVMKADVTPEQIALYHNSEFVDLLSTRRIDELIARPKSYGVNNLYKVKYLRATQPFMNVILLLLAIPTVLTHDPKSLKRAASKCLLLTGLAMGSVFLAQQIASNPPIGPVWTNAWPLLLAWTPLFIFGPLSVWLMTRVKT